MQNILNTSVGLLYRFRLQNTSFDIWQNLRGLIETTVLLYGHLSETTEQGHR